MRDLPGPIVVSAPPLEGDAVRALIASVLEVDVAMVGAGFDLIDAGMDSLRLMKLAGLLRRGGIDVSFAELLVQPTLEGVLALVGRGEAAPAETTEPAAQPSNPDQPFELAPMQHAYFIGRDAAQPLGGVAAHFYAELDGAEVDAERLERAVRRTNARHGMLRVRFTNDGRQWIGSDAWRGLTMHDLRSGDEEPALLSLRDRLSHRRLDVVSGEVWDVQLSLLPERRTRVHINIDMLVADAVSFRIILADLARFYLRDEDIAPIQYDFRRYLEQQRRGRTEPRARAQAYWRAQLEALPAAPSLPVAVAPELLREHRVGRRFVSLSAESWRRLAERARRHGLTVSLVLATAFSEVIASFSEQQRFLLNLPLFDRQSEHTDVQALVGDFTNLLLVGVDLCEGDSFLAHARRLQERFIADATHAAYSGVDVLRDLARLQGGAVTAPVVFTSAIGLGELFSCDVRACLGVPGWTISQAPQVGLDCQVTERESGLLFNWDAAEELFTPGVLDAMFAAQKLMLAWLEAPDSDWDRPLPDLLQPQVRAVRARVNATERPQSTRLLHEGFFARAVEQPSRLAVASGDTEALSYGALAEQARRLAALLGRHQLAPSEAVGVTLPKGAGQLIATLGILQAGGAYVPVGVEQPAARRTRMYERAGVRLVVTTAAVRAVDEWPASVTVLALEDAVDLMPALAGVSVPVDALAYVIFTSGSTGEPKGVMVSHRAAVNTIDDLNRRFAIGEDDRVLAVSALDFDLSVYDIFGLLAAGGAVVVPSEAERRDAACWVELVRRWEVTVWQSVPALLDMVLVAGAGGGLEGLRLAILGGDWVGLDLRARLPPSCRLVALGGTTETAIHSTVFEVREVLPAWRSIPYGAPLTNVRCRIVSNRGDDCPDWVPGELWIGGVSVADGYCGDPERTARQFLMHEGVRYYRTGDMARYWPDGTLEFLGRRDHQVKLRGHRIELGEIEAVIQSFVGVSRAIATTVASPAPHLAVAVVGASVVEEELRGFLADRLPDYMVPQRIVICDDLPHSKNDKIDRKAVTEWLARETVATRVFATPLDGVEATLAALWTELLGVERVARDDSFFALGGDSLLATRMVARLRAAGIDGGELRRLFSSPVLADFAATLRQGEPPAARAALAPDLQQRHAPFPLTDVQRAYWLGRRSQLPLSGVASHWYWEFESESLDVARLERAWNRLVVRHEMMRAIIDERGLQRILPSVPSFLIATEAVTVDGWEAALARQRAAMSHRAFELSSWPLFDVRALRRADGRTRLAFSFDYIMLDALSITNIFIELAALYTAPERELAPIGVSFRDYVLAVRPDECELEAARAYWLPRAAELPGPPALPLRCDPARIESPRFTRREARLAAAAWQRLKQKARQAGLTPAAVLATAYADVLVRWSARSDLTLNFTLFNRRDAHPDIYRVVGDFTSLLLVPYRAGAPSEAWIDGARRLQQEVWAGLQHGSYSALSVARERGRRLGITDATMPVVFTSTLGVADEFADLSLPFGEYVQGVSQTPQVWIDNQVMEQRGALRFNWDAVEDLFPAGVLDAMFAAYVDLLGWLAASDTDLASPAPDPLPAAQRAVRVEVNTTDGPISDGRLHDGFFGWAAREPERTALIGSDGETMSYGELSLRALRIAGWLAGRGVGAGDAVLVSLPKGAEQVTAVLGILAAGAAYVPVGVEQPPARRERIRAAAGTRLVLDDLQAALTGTPLTRPMPVGADTLAYIIFTSGSTGEPKGVMVTHRAATNTIDDVNARYGVGASDRVLAVSALDFDLSVYDLFGLLGAGGTVVLIAEDDRRDARCWCEAVRRHSVTLWNSVPALLDMLLVAAGGQPLPSLRLALASGDWVGLDLRARLAAASPDSRLIALGGATEAAIWSNAFEVREVPSSWRSIPYGFPLRNQSFRVVASGERDCPDWVPGEIWIGGASVALGYRGDEVRTAAHFVERAGRRWYRTGDLGRYWPDGTLEFLGRADEQVKLRGHRIELGEIEAALGEHPAVEHAIALLVTEPTPRIVAFVVWSADQGGDDLRAFAAARLPSYMVPEHIHATAALPLSANGKVDRRALALLSSQSAAAADDIPPGNTTEAAVSDALHAVLGVRAGRTRSFFALGGDSLSGTRLIELLRQRLGFELSLKELFAAPTVAEIAAALTARAEVEAHLEDGVL